MDIRNLTLPEILDKIKHHVKIYFNDWAIEEPEKGLFEESVILYGEECRHLIPKEHNHRFKDSDIFNAA